jgi:hypothetical protein
MFDAISELSKVVPSLLLLFLFDHAEAVATIVVLLVTTPVVKKDEACCP